MAEDAPPNVMAPAAAVPKRTPLPDFADIVFLLIIMLLVNLVPDFVLGDGSTGWHLYTGQYILSHGQVPHTDLFSYTFPDKHWVPYEWLFDVIAGGLFNLGGIKLVAIATDCALASLFALIYYRCRQERCHFALVMLLVTLGILTSTIHWMARPHIFTFFGLLIFSTALERFRRGECIPKRFILTLALTMVVWANAHPGFLIGLGIIGIYMVCETFVGLLSSDSSIRSAYLTRGKWLAIALVTTIAASLINANGPQLYAYIFQYLGRGDVLAVTNEFMQPSFKQLHGVCLALLFFFFIVGMFLSKRKPALSQLMAVLAFAWLAINSMRNEPLFAIVALPTICALYADADLTPIFGGIASGTSGWFERIRQLWNRTGNTVDEMEASCNMHLMPILTIVILVTACFTGGRLFGADVVTADWNPKTKPTTTMEAMKSLPETAGFNLDNWGGYITLKTGRRVFIDDRLDFYGNEFFRDYGRMVEVRPQWDKLLDKYKIGWILMPRQATVVAALKQNPDWVVHAEDPAATLLVRRSLLKSN